MQWLKRHVNVRLPLGNKKYQWCRHICLSAVKKARGNFKISNVPHFQTWITSHYLSLITCLLIYTADRIVPFQKCLIAICLSIKNSTPENLKSSLIARSNGYRRTREKLVFETAQVFSCWKKNYISTSTCSWQFNAQAMLRNLIPFYEHTLCS